MASARPLSFSPLRSGPSRGSSRRAGRAGKLWQLPLLLASLALFGFAAYLFIDPKPGPTLDQKIKVAREYLVQERPDAAIEQLNKLLTNEKLDKAHEGRIHLMLAEAIGAAEFQKNAKVRIPRRHEQIIEQTTLALAMEVEPDYEIHRRLAESYEALRDLPNALKHYQAAMALDPTHSIRMHRKIIDLHLNHEDTDGADTALVGYLARKDLSDAERSWALCESAHLKIDREHFSDAKVLLAEAAALVSDPLDQGQINYWLGYCAWNSHDPDEADRILRVARGQMRPGHPLDGDASYILGHIAQEKNEWETANSLYETVIVNHPESRFAALARLGRGVCRVATERDEAGLTDLHNLTDLISQHEEAKEGKAKYQTEVIEGLRQAAEMLAKRANYAGALELLAYEEALSPEIADEHADRDAQVRRARFFTRLGNVYEKRGDQTDKAAARARTADQIKLTQQARDYRASAGDAFIAAARALTLTDDKGYGEGLWHGIDLYDRAGDLKRAVSALRLFVAERPNDPLAPDALLRLGRDYQAMGAYDEAIAAYQQNLFRHPTALAASKSAVPLAQAYIAKGPDYYGKAEKTLTDVLANPLITPEALEFRQSLFELAQLYYRTNRFEDALSKLEELTQRYANDEKLAQTMFLMADSYRKSANQLVDRQARPRPGDGGLDPTALEAARRLRLTKARALYDRVIEACRLADPKDEAARLYQKLSHFYRADCAYDLRNYAEAIRLYDTAAFRYQDDPSALSAYVQIVNSYCALGRFDEAKTANERAKVLLKKMPADAFANGSFAMPKEYWQEWLKWTGDSGILK